MKLLVQFNNQVKSSYVLRSIYIILFLAAFNPFLIAQDEINKATMTLMKGSYEEGSRILEFKPNKLLLQVKLRNTKQFTQQEIDPVNVQEISINYGFSNGAGAIKGLLLGTLLGAGLSVASGSESSLGYLGGGVLMGSTLGTLFGLAIGSKKNKRFKINGKIETYHENLTEMQELLIVK